MGSDFKKDLKSSIFVAALMNLVKPCKLSIAQVLSVPEEQTFFDPDGRVSVVILSGLTFFVDFFLANTKHRVISNMVRFKVDFSSDRI